jgi:hypothetical protein
VGHGAGTIVIAAIPIPAEKPNYQINADPAIAAVTVRCWDEAAAKGLMPLSGCG